MTIKYKIQFWNLSTQLERDFQRQTTGVYLCVLTRPYRVRLIINLDLSFKI